MVIGSIIIMLGISPLMVLNTDLVVASVPPEKTGTASSLSEMSSDSADHFYHNVERVHALSHA